MPFAIRPAVTVLLLVAPACAGPDQPQSGGFALQQLNGLARDPTGANVTSHTDFDLGELLASRDFYFLLANTGAADITDITLTSSSPAFVVKPSAIGVLPPGGGAIVPIVRISAVHGVALDGVGFAPLLPQGMTDATIAIHGTTMGGNGVEDVALDAALRVDAKVMDIELRSGSQLVDLTRPVGSMSTNLGGLGFTRSYSYTPAAGAQITNTGNIDIDLTFYEDDNHVIGHASASPAQTVPVALGSVNTIVGVSSGAVTDNRRLQLGNDGAAYFALLSR